MFSIREQMHIERTLRIVTRGHDAVALVIASSLRGIDALCSLTIEELSHFLKALKRQSGQFSVGLRTDIEKQVGTLR